MHHRAPLLLTLAGIAALSLAGCASDAPEPDATAETLPALHLPWSMTGCRFAVLVLGVPASAVEPYVPQGFRVQSVAEVAIGGQTGLPVPNPAADGNFGIEAFQCDEGTGLNGMVPGMTYASFFAGVEPPEELRRDVANHFVKWDVLVPDAPRRELLASYGVPARNGTAVMAADVVGGLVAELSGSFAAEGMGSFGLDARAGIPLPECSFAEFQPLASGALATWTMECAVVSGGGAVGTVTVPADSWAAKVVGPGAHQGGGFAGIVDFSEGRIELPEQQPATLQA